MTIFQELFLTVLFLLKKNDWGPPETVSYNLKSTYLKRVAALSVELFLVDSVFFHTGETTVR